MGSMFSRASEFNQPLNNRDDSQGTVMHTAMSSCEQVTVITVSDMGYMFFGAGKFNQPLSDWDVSQSTRYAHHLVTQSTAHRQYSSH